ncbi:HlyD family efflux transporter periplasmic adaptor subunit [Ferrimicrobium sp.]|uniref:efflux RND transporter periplasmic adaptor subunit n=1 Tax=Ferrimicrobium sp. TaxID=2926050 RepID=UPI0026253373|nr:HlyD family efflux transporter periplasmic adaptor subunit [Ferrimicrobium sp.]
MERLHRQGMLVRDNKLCRVIKVLVVVVVGGATGFFISRPAPPAYQLAYAEPETITATISAVGTLVPVTQAAVPPPMSGTVSSIGVQVGQRVTAGETLATVSPSALASRARIADASALAQAEAALAEAEQPTPVPAPKSSRSSALQSDVNAIRKTLVELCPGAHSSVSPACGSLNTELSRLSSQLSAKTSDTSSPGPEATSTSSATIAADEAIVTADQSALSSALQVQSSSFVSPIAGTVATLPLAVGQVVRAQSSSTAITVIQSSRSEVVVPIAIATARRLHDGDQATILPLGSPHATTGEIISIGTAPTTNQVTGATTVSVTVAVNHLTLPVFDGAQALVVIAIAHSADVLAVPTSAIFYKGGHPTVLVDNPRGIFSDTVRVGIVGADYTSILGGLSDGVPVVLASLDRPLPVPVKPIGGFGKAFGQGGARRKVPRL